MKKQNKAKFNIKIIVIKPNEPKNSIRGSCKRKRQQY